MGPTELRDPAGHADRRRQYGDDLETGALRCIRQRDHVIIGATVTAFRRGTALRITSKVKEQAPIGGADARVARDPCSLDRHGPDGGQAPLPRHADPACA